MSHCTLPDHLSEFAKYATKNHDPAHNHIHSHMVFNIALKIVAEEKIQLTTEEWTIFPYVMMGHDFLDHKIKDKLSDEEVWNYYAASVGAELADIITHIHDNCSWSKRTTAVPAPRCDVLRTILMDADRVEGMDIRRCFQFSAHAHADYTPEQMTERMKYIVPVRLWVLRDSFHYESSRRLAHEKYLPALEAFMDEHGLPK